MSSLTDPAASGQAADPTAEGPTLVVGLDGLEHDADAVALARSLHRAFGGSIILTYVMRAAVPGRGMAEFEAIERRDGRELLARAAEGLPPQVETRLIEPRPAAEGLTAVAAAVEASMLVLGSSHRGTLGRVVPGGVASQLLTRAPCAIAVAPVGYARKADDPITGIGVAYDATDESDAALAAAAGAAIRLRRRLHLYHAMHVVPPAPEWDRFRTSMHAFAEGLLDQGRKQLPEGLDHTAIVLEGDTAVAVAGAAAEDGVGALFVGSRGYGPLREALLGGVAGALLRTARCPLVIVPRRARPILAGRPLADESVSAAG